MGEWWSVQRGYRSGRRVFRCCISALLGLSLSPALMAQRAANPQAGTLPPHTRAVVEQLGRLRALDADGWRYHSGDLPHGEDPSLDDSSWQMVDRRGDAPTSAVWYRRWFEMPKDLEGYDLSGTRIWFQFRVDARGPVTEIIYFNGSRVALGEGLEPVVLFDHTKPGSRILVAVKLLETVSDKTFNGASAMIEYPSSRPDPTQLYQELLAIHGLLPILPDSARATETMEDAAADVDMGALTTNDTLGSGSR